MTTSSWAGRHGGEDDREGREQLAVGSGRSPVAARYARNRAAAPTIDDVATVAVEQKGAGRSIDGAVAGRVGSHLGHDFSTVQVHDDPLSQQATAAMGARAFAYGGDVFLGPGESDGDLGLMAHELTHVAQQGAAGQRLPQRQVTVGAANSPAEQQADAVAAEVTGGARPHALLVDELPVQPGQMLKSQFIEQLRAQITAAANQELGPIWSAAGCPYIDRYFAQYAGQPATAGEAMLRRYAPDVRGAADAASMMPIVVERVRVGIQQWRETGQAPAEVAGVDGGGPAAAAAATPTAQAMGRSESLDSTTAARLGGAMGTSFGDVRIHTGPEAARFADQHQALAVAVGRDVAFAAGAYAPGSLEGDALLAHELAHVVQQRGGDESPEAQRQALASPAGAALEGDADQAALGAMAQLHGDDERVARSPWARLKSGIASLASGAGPQLRSDLSLARCNADQRANPTGIHYDRGAHNASNPSPETWGDPDLTQDEGADHDEVLDDAATMDAGGVFVFFGHGNATAVQSDDEKSVTTSQLSGALSRDGDPPTVVVLGACLTAGMMSGTASAGVPVVIGVENKANSVFLAGSLDLLMIALRGGKTFTKALAIANDQLAKAPGYEIEAAEFMIQFAPGYNGDMTLEEARAQDRDEDH